MFSHNRRSLEDSVAPDPTLDDRPLAVGEKVRRDAAEKNRNRSTAVGEFKTIGEIFNVLLKRVFDDHAADSQKLIREAGAVRSDFQGSAEIDDGLLRAAIDNVRQRGEDN